MAWDDGKDTFRQRSDVPPDEKLTASEWNAHVDDQENHSGRHEDGGSDELSVDGLSGVLADAQTPQTEAVEDIVGALLAGGTNISLTYDDANDVLTIDTAALNEEEVEDAVATLVTAGSGITVNYDDGAGTLSIAVDESALSFYDGMNVTADVDNQSVTTEREHNKANALSYDGADLGEQINNAIADVGKIGTKVTVQGGDNEDAETVRVIETPVDLTDTREMELDLNGVIMLSTGGQPAIERTDAVNQTLNLDGCLLYGDPANPPSVGILNGHNTNAPSDLDTGPVSRGPEMRWIRGGGVAGHFGIAPLFVHGKERDRYDTDFMNNGSVGYAAVLTPNNRVQIGGEIQSVTAVYKSLDDGASGSSVSKQWFAESSLFSRDAEGDGLLYVQGSQDVVLRSVEFRSNGEPMIYCDVSQGAIRSLTFENARGRVDNDVSTDATADLLVVDDFGDGDWVTDLTFRNVSFEMAWDSSNSGRTLVAKGGASIRDISYEGRVGFDGTDGSVVGPNALIHDSISGDVDRTPVFDNGGADQHALQLRRDQGVIENVTAKSSTDFFDAIRVANGETWQLVNRVYIPESAHNGMRVSGGSGTVIANTVIETTGNSRSINCDGTHGLIFNCDLAEELYFGSNATENLVVATRYASLSDNGTRNVVNGHARNSGDPRSTGDWNGYADYAHRVGATVWDTSTSPWTEYQPAGDGSGGFQFVQS